MSKIVHIMVKDKFNVPFINFIKQNFNISEHKFIFLHRKDYDYGMSEELAEEVKWFTKDKIMLLLLELYKADKIIIHGLRSEGFVKILFFNSWLLKKCYWVMWGGDFYFPEKQSFFKKQVIKRIKNFITYVEGDYELVKKWYGANGKLYNCFMYPSNLYKNYDIYFQKKDDCINIQIGNSADDTNKHFEIFEKLLPYKERNIRIYAPLSYSDHTGEYTSKVINKGKELFGDKFIPITDFMPFEEYLKFLSKIDLAIFAHNRQQAMGNIITLLGLGKKVYIKSNITTWKMLNRIGVKIFDFNKGVDLGLMSEDDKKKNTKIVKECFSEKNLIKQLNIIFNKKDFL